MVLVASVLLASALQMVPVAEPAPEPTPEPQIVLTGPQVMERVHARAQANAIARNGLAWVKTKTVFDVGDYEAANGTNEHVRETETWRMWVRNNVTWQQRTSRNGKPKKDKPEPPDANLAAGLITWYAFVLDPTPIQPEPGTGLPCWVIHFTPSGIGEPKGLMEEVASRMSGTMYIDQHGFWIRSASGNLPVPYRKFLVINAQRVRFSMVQAEELGAVVTRKLVVTFEYSLLLSDAVQRQEFTYSDFSLDAVTPSP